jgi:hypothetical protein
LIIRFVQTALLTTPATTTKDIATRFLIALVGRSERLIEKPTLDQDWFWQLARRGRSRRARPPVSRIGTGWRRRTFENYLPRANGWQWKATVMCFIVEGRA